MSLGRGPRRYCSVVTGSFFGGTSPSCKKSTYYLFTSLLFIIQVFSTPLERVRIFFCPTSGLQNRSHIVKFAILPHLTYCQSVWDFRCSSDARKLERIQERALRAVYCDNKSTYKELLQKANLPTLYTRRLQDLATIMDKAKNNLVPLYIADLFIVNNSQYSLRNSEFVLPRFKRLHMASRA